MKIFAVIVGIVGVAYAIFITKLIIQGVKREIKKIKSESSGQG